MMTRRDFVGLAGAALANPLAQQAGWRAATATVDITPETSLWMAGFARRTQPSQGVAMPLHAKALALRRAGGAACVLVTADLLGLTARITGRIASIVQRRHGV